MLHTDDDFLRAIESQPADRTLRLVFADWLDEHARPAAAELIRVEEEMRALPVFADRFWELKPRRNELRALAGSEWCGRMRYGTECEPVFRHGIPDGWRERWRLIREFTERWHCVPMGDVGGRQAEIVNTEKRLKRKVPPSVGEWIAFALDRPGFLTTNETAPIPGQAAVSLRWTKDTQFDGRMGDSHEGVRFADFGQPDPPVYTYQETFNTDYQFEFVSAETACAETVSTFALRDVLSRVHGVGGYHANIEPVTDLIKDLNRTFPVRMVFGNGEWYESDNIIVGIERVQPWPWRKGEFDVSVQHATPLCREQIPEFLWAFARDNSSARGLFAPQ